MTSSPPPPHGEFGVALFSLHRTIRDGLPLREIPALCREKLGIRILDPTYPVMDLADDHLRHRFREAADRAGCRIQTVAVGTCGDLSARNEAERKSAVENHLLWFDRCLELGAVAFRANTGGEGGEEDPDTLKACIRSFRQLVERSAETGVTVLIENHGGLSGNPDRILEIIESVGSERLRTIPDFGNFHDETRYGDLERILPHAFAVHAKTREFRGAEHVSYDLERCVDLVCQSGFNGILSIEFEGPVGGPAQPRDEWEGILRTKTLLERALSSR